MSIMFAKESIKGMTGVITALLKHFENNLKVTTYLLQVTI